MYKNYSKYEKNEDGKYDVFYKGFDYKNFRPTNGWKKMCTVETEDEAKQKMNDLLNDAE